MMMIIRLFSGIHIKSIKYGEKGQSKFIKAPSPWLAANHLCMKKKKKNLFTIAKQNNSVRLKESYYRL